MDIQWKMNTVNQVMKGTQITPVGDEPPFVCLVLKGRVFARSNGASLCLGVGSFLFSIDIYQTGLSWTYTAIDDVILYAFSVYQPEELPLLFEANKEYRGLLVFSLSRQLNELYRAQQELSEYTGRLYTFVKDTYKQSAELCMKLQQPFPELPQIEKLQPFQEEVVLDERKLGFYTELSQVPLEQHKSFFVKSDLLVLYHVEEISQLMTAVCGSLATCASYIETLFYCMLSKSGQGLFHKLAQSCLLLERMHNQSEQLMQLLDATLEEINQSERLLQQKSGLVLTVDRERMEKLYYSVLMGQDGSALLENEASEDVQEDTLASLQDSLQQLLEFASWESEKSEAFTKCIEAYLRVENKDAPDDGLRKLRKQLSVLFYELYEVVFLRAYEIEKKRAGGVSTAHMEGAPKAVELFLQFGYVDERLLTEQQLIELCHASLDQSEGPCKVYTIYEWLKLIYEGKRVPSKSEFDMEFVDVLREMKQKSGAQEAEEYERNPRKRLSYEIQNLFTYNNKLIQGRITTFVPVLCDASITNNLSMSFLRKSKVNHAIQKLMELDPSVFHRELLYMNQESRIEKEYIMKQVFPEIILFPIVGSNGVMWQEITGKRRDTAGRFLLPVFLETNIEDVLIRVFGRYRWELCRTQQGSAWNNIQYRSLTSEYFDFIQFYRKNRDLSEDRREKLRLQLQKAKNNSREFFVLDYEVWIKYEAFGAMRLNKVSREILATYCPFPKAKRQELRSRPAFDEAFQRFERTLAKKNYELDVHYRNLEKDHIVLTTELVTTRRYYLEL